MIAGDSWGLVTLPIIEHCPVSGVFLIFMFISLQVALMNVVLACVVDSAAQARVDDLSGDSVKRKLQALCDDLDDDGSGEISFDELEHGFASNREFKRRMNKMDIHENDIDVVWDILDSDNYGTIRTDEFVEELAGLKKASPHTMLFMIRHYVTEIRDKIKEQLVMMRADLEEAEKKELEIAEQMRTEEHELTENVSKLMRSRSKTDVLSAAPLGAQGSVAQRSASAGEPKGVQASTKPNEEAAVLFRLPFQTLVRLPFQDDPSHKLQIFRRCQGQMSMQTFVTSSRTSYR